MPRATSGSCLRRPHRVAASLPSRCAVDERDLALYPAGH